MIESPTLLQIPKKQAIHTATVALLPTAAETAQQIFAWHELSGEEHKSAGFLAKKLQAAGATVELGTAGLPTAFKATFGNGAPRVALLAEYDALPEMGHACGHNLSGTASTYAALTLVKSDVLKNTPGSLIVLGCPMEETGGGKIKNNLGAVKRIL